MEKGKGKKEILTTLNHSGSIQVKKSELPEEWSFDAADFINRLIQRRTENRLGYFGFYQIKSHPWLKDFPWQKISDKTLDAPFKPKNDFIREKKSKEDEKSLQARQNIYQSNNLSENDRKMLQQRRDPASKQNPRAHDAHVLDREPSCLFWKN